MNKIEKIYNILRNRLPKKYIIPIKLFKDNKSLLRKEAKRTHRTYCEMVDYYNRYFANPKKATYVTTKGSKTKKRNTALDIVAFGGRKINSIWVAKKELSKKSKRRIAFILLHEIKHCFQVNTSERKADMFAIRWIRKLIKEKII